ncbi:MAG: class I SAM-dependent methyltransferase [Candidatus Obscuribacter sp.]|nr:class I SAM-dependent methyltransferase [Candidatus Obscuribacter sp.]
MVEAKMKAPTLDPIWEEKYSSGQVQRYPWDCIVTFVYRHYPRDKERSEVKILEVGCGTGSNLWFAAREGFNVSGIDGSASAIKYAQERFQEEGLNGDLRVGDFTDLPFADNSFDLVIDRGALTCCGLSAGRLAVKEVARVLKPGGFFHANPYSQRSSSYLAGGSGPDGLSINIEEGSLTGVGQVCFYSRRELAELFGEQFELTSVKHLEIQEEQQANYMVHAEWRAIAKVRK